MGCGSSSASSAYKAECAKAIEDNRDVMRGLRLTAKQMEELYHCHLQLCGLHDDSPYLDKLFKIFDTDGSGELGYREFVLGIWSILSLEEGDLASFTFWMYDTDYNGHLELDELMHILNDVHGAGTKNPNGRSHHTPHYARAVNHFKQFSAKKHKAKRDEQAYVTAGEFIGFSKSTPSLLWPAFNIQRELHAAIVGNKYDRVHCARMMMFT